MYVVINTDTRSVMPNRQHRIIERRAAARTRVAALRSANENRPLLATTPGCVNWITGGLSDPIDITSSSDPVWVLACDAGEVLITSEIEAPRLRHDFDVANSGWDVVAVPWFEPDAPLNAATDYCETPISDFLCDRETIGLDVTNKLIRARMVLSTPEQEDLRDLGAVVAAALYAGIDAWVPGTSTDYDVAAVIAFELERHGAKAVCLIVGGDERVPLREKVLRQVLSERNCGPLEILVRGVDVDPDALRRRLRPTGSQPLSVVITRIGSSSAARTVAFVCQAR